VFRVHRERHVVDDGHDRAGRTHGTDVLDEERVESIASRTGGEVPSEPGGGVVRTHHPDLNTRVRPPLVGGARTLHIQDQVVLLARRPEAADQVRGEPLVPGLPLSQGVSVDADREPPLAHRALDYRLREACLGGRLRDWTGRSPRMPEITNVGIDGVLLVPLVSHPDGRGSFTEDYRRSWIPKGREMVQGNVSLSREGVLRGLHFHRDQADWWTYYTGVATVGLFDLRLGSPSEGVGIALRIDTDQVFSSLYIPPGVAHGFWAEQDLILHYMVDRYHTGEDEFGVAWDDPGLGIVWPGREPLLSDRDRSNPSLAEVLRTAPAYAPG
jgi:dTDP-4-dehydrorhamnose 3,5-epimerase